MKADKSTNKIEQAKPQKPLPKNKQERDLELFAYTNKQHAWSYNQMCNESPVNLSEKD